MSIITKYLKYFLCGIAFGIANIIPGVSGGTMLVVFGIFDLLTEAISGVKAIISNIKFLLAFGLGAGTGILFGAFVISDMLTNYSVQTNMFFIGLILGSMPLIVKIGTELPPSEQTEERRSAKITPLCAIPFVIAAALVIGLAVLENRVDIASDAAEGFNLLLSLKILGCAVIAATAMIIPGISGSFVMMLLGVYGTIIGAVKGLNFFVLIPFAVGAVIGIVGGAKVISILIKKYKLMTYSALCGMVVGSVYAILPEGFGFNMQTGYGFVFLVIGVVAAALVAGIDKRTEAEK